MTDLKIEALVQRVNRNTSLLERHGPTCPCLLVYAYKDIPFPSRWALRDSTGKLHAYRSYLISLEDVPEDRRECYICKNDLDKEEDPPIITTECCRNVVGQRCLSRWVGVSDFRECMLQDYQGDLPRACPVCRRPLVWWPITEDEINTEYLKTLVQIFDRGDYHLTTIRLPRNSVIYVHSDILAWRFTRRMMSLARRDFSALLKDEDDQILFDLLRQAVEAYGGKVIPLDDFVKIIYSKLETSILIAKYTIKWDSSQRLAMFKRIIRFWILKWWVGCHVSQALDEFDLEWKSRVSSVTLARRPATDFGVDALLWKNAEMPRLPARFQVMPEFNWLNDFLTHEWLLVDVFLASTNAAAYEVMEKAISDLRHVSQYLYRHGDNMDDQQTRTIDEELFRLQGEFLWLWTLAMRKLKRAILQRQTAAGQFPNTVYHAFTATDILGAEKNVHVITIGAVAERMGTFLPNARPEYRVKRVFVAEDLGLWRRDVRNRFCAEFDLPFGGVDVDMRNLMDVDMAG